MSFVSSSREPDFGVGPLAFVAGAAFIRAARQRKKAPLVIGLVAAAVEFGWPPYNRFKRNQGVPTFLAHYPGA